MDLFTKEHLKEKYPVKGLPGKNSPSGITGDKKNLMNKEYIVVMQKK